MKDIAPTFLEALTCLPVEALIEMEIKLSSEKTQPVLSKVIYYIQAEKKNRAK